MKENRNIGHFKKEKSGKGMEFPISVWLGRYVT